MKNEPTSIEKQKAIEQQLRAANQQLAANNHQLISSEQQLRAANQQLVANNQQLIASEKEIKKQAHDLGERVKELDCLYGISEIVSNKETIEEILQDTANIIPTSWQFPKITCAKITLRNTEFKTSNYEDSKWKLSTDIIVKRKIAGKIEVCYLEQRSQNDIDPFLKEEIALLDNITERLGRIIERKNAEKELKASNQQLISSEQQLKASNQQLTASEQQLRAANQQLAANNQQLISSEMQLKATISKFEALFEGINDAIFVHPFQKSGFVNFVEVNEAACKLLGYSKSELLKMSAKDISVPQDVSKQGKNISRGSLLKDGYSLFEATHISKTGSQIPVEINSRVFDLKGKKMILSLARDITERKKAEKALKESEELSKKLIATVPDIIIRTDVNGNIVFCNDAILRLFPNITFEDLLGKNMLSFFSEKDRLKAEKNTKLMFEQPLRVKEYQIQLANVIYDFEINGDVLRDASSKPTGMVYILRDITERKQSEEAMKESEEKYRNLVERANDGICIILDGIVKFVNPRLIDLWGGTAEEIINAQFTNFIHPDELNKLAEYYNRRIKGEAFPSIYESVLLQKNGNEVFVELSAGVINYQGKPADLVIIRDITGRKKAEEALQNSEKRLKILFESAPDTYYLNDLEGRFTDGNRAAEQLLGYSREEFLGKNFVEMGILTENDEEKALNILKRNINGESTGPDEYDLIKKDGSTVSVEILTHPVVINDEGMVLGLARDITERKQTEEALTHSHNLMKYIIEHSNSAIAVHDKDMNYIYVSQNYLNQYKISEQNIIGKHHYDMFPDLPQKWRDVHQKVLLGETLSSDDDPYEREDGTTDWTRWECRPWYNADGSIGGIIVYTEIITERKLAEEKLLNKMNELEIFNDAAVDRELAINDLRKEINEMLEALGKEKKYDVVT